MSITIEREARTRGAGRGPQARGRSRPDVRAWQQPQGPGSDLLSGATRPAACTGERAEASLTGGHVDALADLVARSGGGGTREEKLRPDGLDVLPVVRDEVASVTVAPVAPVQEPYVPMRLTRRGRLVVTTLVFTGALAALLCLAWPSAAGPAGPTRTVTVTSGATLWSVAEQTAPGEETGDVVADIAELNGLDSAGDLAVGQRLRVPAY